MSRWLIELVAGICMVSPGTLECPLLPPGRAHHGGGTRAACSIHLWYCPGKHACEVDCTPHPSGE